mmetsp:Transcript_13183/g.20358  ORF Transcript_13183/g.20358 Transcript_13183/m.20358 type:complete len:89 (+) Transcript_13183:536-802(+)
MLAPSFSAAVAASVSSAFVASKSDMSRSDNSASATTNSLEDRAQRIRDTRCQFMMEVLKILRSERGLVQEKMTADFQSFNQGKCTHAR